MKSFLKWVVQFIIAIISILLISGFPLLISGFQRREFLWREYLELIQYHATSLLNIKELTVNYYAGREIRQVPVFPQLLDNITYSF